MVDMLVHTGSMHGNRLLFSEENELSRSQNIFSNQQMTSRQPIKIIILYFFSKPVEERL